MVHIQRGHPVGGERARTTEMHDSVFDLLTEKQLRGRNTIKWNFFGPDVLPLWVAEMDYQSGTVMMYSTTTSSACISKKSMPSTRPCRPSATTSKKTSD